MPPKKSWTTTPGTLLSALDTVRLALSGISCCDTKATPPDIASKRSRTVAGACSGALTGAGSNGADDVDGLNGFEARRGAAGGRRWDSTTIGSSWTVAPGVADCARQVLPTVDSINAAVAPRRPAALTISFLMSTLAPMPSPLVEAFNASLFWN